jgi:predicted TIM-barrel fold metal-dependent hydrolase
MIVDAQIHIWEADRPDRPWPLAGADGRTLKPQRANPLSADEALAAMNAAGVHRAILVPPSWEGDRNDAALAAACAHPDRFAVMGRVGADLAEMPRLAYWRRQRNMLGLRVILAQGSAWRSQGRAHWLWDAAETQGLPLMVAPSGALSLVGEIATSHPGLKIIIDHMGARADLRGPQAFSDLEILIGLARLPNVAVKATCLPAYSMENRPWTDVMPYLRRIFEAFGPKRLFWGSDLSRLPCAYTELVDVFLHNIEWLSGQDRDDVMGEALLRWLGWSVGI